MWSNVGAAYDALSRACRVLATLTARHRGRSVLVRDARTLGPENAERAREEFGGKHARCVCSTGTGPSCCREPGYTVAIEGFHHRRVERFLRMRSTREQTAFHYRHKWARPTCHWTSTSPPTWAIRLRPAPRRSRAFTRAAPPRRRALQHLTVPVRIRPKFTCWWRAGVERDRCSSPR